MGPLTTAVPLAVLVHGAGDTSRVWSGVQRLLAIPSEALDLRGRGRHPSDLAEVDLACAVDQAVADIEQATRGPIVPVAHSIAGAVSPPVVAALGGRVRQLVHIAAVSAPEGEMPLAIASNEFANRMLEQADVIEAAVRGGTYVAGPGDEFPDGLRPITDQMAVTRVDSLHLGCAPTTWVGVDPGLPRTFVRPMRDRLYPPTSQMRLAAAMGADEIIEVDAGHNAMRTASERIAAIINDVALRYC